mmetsp:Transcript_7535/g.15332  ORF Transcript_7535/g.15332 Transcript_7535/m.15332 type:complete len:84 (+) Transcript_7535:219-470(+)
MVSFHFDENRSPNVFLNSHFLDSLAGTAIIRSFARYQTKDRKTGGNIMLSQQPKAVMIPLRIESKELGLFVLMSYSQGIHRSG